MVETARWIWQGPESFAALQHCWESLFSNNFDFFLYNMHLLRIRCVSCNRFSNATRLLPLSSVVIPCTTKSSTMFAAPGHPAINCLTMFWYCSAPLFTPKSKLLCQNSEPPAKNVVMIPGSFFHLNLMEAMSSLENNVFPFSSSSTSSTAGIGIFSLRMASLRHFVSTQIRTLIIFFWRGGWIQLGWTTLLDLKPSGWCQGQGGRWFS